MTYDSFQTFAKDRGLDDQTFPYADAGFMVLRVFMVFLRICIIVTIIGLLALLTNTWVDGATFGTSPVAFEGLKIGSITLLPAIYTPTDTILSVTSSTVAMATKIDKLIVLSIFPALIVVYMFLVVMRWHNWERGCLKSDVISYHDKSKIVDVTNTKRKIREFRRSKRKASKNSSDSNELTVDETSKINALKSFKHVRVRRHLRDAVDGSGLRVSERVIFEVPVNEGERAELMNLIKDFDKVLNRLKHGELTFGDMLVSTDHSTIEYRAEMFTPDPYDYEEIVADTKETNEYWRAFSYDIVKSDNDDIIDERREAAMAWAEKTAKAIDKILTTKESAAQRLALSCSSSTVLIRYELSFHLEAKSFESLAASLDNALRTKGSTVRVDSGDLLISIMLPSNKVVPISIVRMYEEVFG